MRSGRIGAGREPLSLAWNVCPERNGETASRSSRTSCRQIVFPANRLKPLEVLVGQCWIGSDGESQGFAFSSLKNPGSLRSEPLPLRIKQRRRHLLERATRQAGSSSRAGGIRHTWKLLFTPEARDHRTSAPNVSLILRTKPSNQFLLLSRDNHKSDRHKREERERENEPVGGDQAERRE